MCLHLEKCKQGLNNIIPKKEKSSTGPARLILTPEKI